jgi:hypothetical protein
MVGKGPFLGSSQSLSVKARDTVVGMTRESGQRGVSAACLWFAIAGVVSSIQCSGENRVYEEDADGGSAGSSAGTSSSGGDGSGGKGGGTGAAGGSAGKGGAGGSNPDPSGGTGNTGGAEDGGVGGNPDVPCQGSVSSLRLWKLHLGQSDYVSLKNTGECQVALGGLNIVFDDRDDAFPEDTDVDCTVQLPEVTLAPGGSIRVHEDGLPGDIAALDEDVTVTTCGSGVPFNPQRGGVTYLCDGPCAEATVLDVVAHQGYDVTYGEPPALLYGVDFSAPLDGITDAGQNSQHFRREATEGVKPDFLGSDWRLEQRTLYAGFEDGLEVQFLDGTPEAWDLVDGQSADIATSATTAAVGTVSLRITHSGSDGVSDALMADLTGIDQPTEFSYFARVDSATGVAGFFDLLMDPFSAMQLSFKPSGLGAERENGQRTETDFEDDTWYQIEGRDIDYTERRFDLYVNRQLVAARVPFWTNAPFVDQLLLYSVSAGSVAYYDEIELWE